MAGDLPCYTLREGVQSAFRAWASVRARHSPRSCRTGDQFPRCPGRLFGHRKIDEKGPAGEAAQAPLVNRRWGRDTTLPRGDHRPRLTARLDYGRSGRSAQAQRLP